MINSEELPRTEESIRSSGIKAFFLPIQKIDQIAVYGSKKFY
jgi:hypothetical protein